MKGKKSISMLLAATLCIGAGVGTMSGCFKKKTVTVGELTIRYLKGSYGDEWINDFAKRFGEESKSPVKVVIESEIKSVAETEIAGGNPSDIYISHDMNIFKMANRGYLADLTDVYASDIDGTKFEDRLIPAAREMAKFEIGGAEKYVSVPYTQGVGGIVYNKTMFDNNGWEIPETYQELKDLCDTINSKDAKLSNGTTARVKPFVWSTKDSYMWDYVVCDWWAQMAGIEKVNKFFEYKDANVYNPAAGKPYFEFGEAFRLWTNLISSKKDNSYLSGNSIPLERIDATGPFVQEKAAMTVNAQWFYNLTKGLNTNFEIAFMKTPKAPNAKKDSEGKDINYNYLVGFGDAMAIPNNATNLQLAKDFVKFCAKKENAAQFTKLTNGAFFAYDYSDTEIKYDIVPDGEEGADSPENIAKIRAKTYVESVQEKLTGVGINVTSKSKFAYMNPPGTGGVGNWTNNELPYKKALRANADEAQANRYLEENYDYAKKNWRRWKSRAE